ncbi:glycoside hydrolase family 3 C-terminal domain-containing protein [Streptomyces sp. NPDC050433]|uniref:glycoside hydrolase family 3 C-terminal domain-containing protein n=1 Tax=Streptomyces sp. NPDC050433 TaxID=3365615 RepID=UPI0037B0E4B3
MAIQETTEVDGLSVPEQVSLTTGAGFWQTVEAGDIPSITMADGPHGLRKQTAATDNLGISKSEPATCFPPAVGLGQTWDHSLAQRVGAALAEEAQAADVSLVLGPGINIKRDPRCGRNFEYFSEDPLLSGAMGSAWVQGLQSRGVGASLKHFALNNQEHDRMRISSDVDDRTMREIYLRAFEQVVRDAQPWTVMCSYNRVNGVHAAQNHWLLTEVLRDEWGFEGAVVSDWGAVVDKVASIAAGLDLQMPGPDRDADAAVTAAVERSELDAAALARTATRITELARRAAQAKRAGVRVNFNAHHSLAREAAAAAVVLLKNERALLPLRPTGAIAVIGEFATEPRYQAGGSSHVNPTRVDVALDEIRAQAPRAQITFSAGFSTRAGDAEALRAEAVRHARDADTAVVFLGLSAAQESEGFDRDHIDLPADQLELLRAVLEVQPDTVVVLSHGGVVRLSNGVVSAPAVLDGALLGQAGGGAIADVLFGHVNPSGRLTESVPERIEDVPAWLSFPGERGSVRYAEGLHVGYRWYDARDMSVTFPFGHGLSYTTFDYSDLAVAADDEGITVTVTVTNSGGRAGREVVQIYTALPESEITRAVRELKGFTAVHLAAGERRTVEIRIARREIATWDTRVDAWSVEGGTYDVHVGASSRDIRLSASVKVDGDDVFVPLTLESSFAEVAAHPMAGPAIEAKLKEAGLGDTSSGSDELGMDVAKMAASIPLGRYLGQGTTGMTREFIEAVLAKANRG